MSVKLLKGIPNRYFITSLLLYFAFSYFRVAA